MIDEELWCLLLLEVNGYISCGLESILVSILKRAPRDTALLSFLCSWEVLLFLISVHNWWGSLSCVCLAFRAPYHFKHLNCCLFLIVQHFWQLRNTSVPFLLLTVCCLQVVPLECFVCIAQLREVHYPHNRNVMETEKEAPDSAASKHKFPILWVFWFLKDSELHNDRRAYYTMWMWR